jgi:hypothetical protein
MRKLLFFNNLYEIYLVDSLSYSHNYSLYDYFVDNKW